MYPHPTPGHVNNRGLRLPKRSDAPFTRRIQGSVQKESSATRAAARLHGGLREGYTAQSVPQQSKASTSGAAQRAPVHAVDNPEGLTDAPVEELLSWRRRKEKREEDEGPSKRRSTGGAPSSVPPIPKMPREPPAPIFRQWKVLKSPNIPVRAEPAMDAERIGMKFAGELVWATAANEDGWVCLKEGGGWLLTELPSFGKLLCCVDSSADDASPESGRERQVGQAKTSGDSWPVLRSGHHRARLQYQDVCRNVLPGLALPDVDFNGQSRFAAVVDADVTLPDVGTSSRCPSRGAAAIDAHAGRFLHSPSPQLG